MSRQRSAQMKDVGTDVKEGGKLALETLKELADAVNVPYLKGLVGVALKVIEVYDQVKSNKKECEELADRVFEITTAILRSAGHRGDDSHPASSELTADITKLEKSVTEISTYMDGLRERRVMRRIIHSTKDSEKLKDLNTQLDRAVMLFQVQGSLSLRVLVGNVERMLATLSSSDNRSKFDNAADFSAQSDSRSEFEIAGVCDEEGEFWHRRVYGGMGGHACYVVVDQALEPETPLISFTSRKAAQDGTVSVV